MADYTRKQLDVDGSYVFPYTHADAVLYTTQNNLDGITSGTETNVKAVLDALDNTYRRLDSNILSLYNSLGKRGFLYLNGTTTTASMELPTLGNDFYIPALKYDGNGNITTEWKTPANIVGTYYVGTTAILATSAAQALTGITSIDAIAYFDTTNSRMGVGTSTPGQKLTVNGGLLAITNNSNTITIGSQNASYCHITNSADIPFFFNKKIITTGSVYPYTNNNYTSGTSGARWSNVYSVLGNFSGDITTAGKIMVGTGGANSYLASDSATNIYLHNSSGAVLVCDGLAVRRGTNITNATLGTSTYPWLALYATTVYENGTSLANKYVTLDTDLSITGEKTFVGTKRINFKLGTTTDKLGFTLYDTSNVQLAYMEYNGGELKIGCYRPADSTATQSYVGFRQVDLPNGAVYNLFTPLPSDAKTPLGLSTTNKNFYFPLLFKNGSTTTLTASSGVVDLSTLIPSYSTKNMGVNGTNYALYTSASSLPTIYAPTALAGTGGYILATNSGKTGLEWVAKPTSNVSTSAVIASSASSTSAISAALDNPYYNLIEGTSVANSIRFNAGTGISVSATTDNLITFSNTITNMSLLTNNLFINGTQTAATGSWTGNLPAGITSLYNGFTIFYRLPYAGSGNASLQLYAPDGVTTVGDNCPVYGGNTRLTTHFPLYSIIRMTYYNGNWRANPWYNTDSYVQQSNTESTNYRPILLGYLSDASPTGIATTSSTNISYKTTNLTYSSIYGKMYMTSDLLNQDHGYYIGRGTSTILGLAIGSDGVTRGLRDEVHDSWLCYCDDNTGTSLKVPGTLIPNLINLAGHCLITYDSTNECINFIFL